MREFKYDVVQLIHGVRDRPCLWDKTLDNYKDRVERRGAWEEIFNSLDETYEQMTPEEKRITGEQILNKWTNIRDTFIKSLKTRMGKPKKKYLLYNHLEFLTKIIPEDENSLNITINEQPAYMKQEEPDARFSVSSELEPETGFTISSVSSYSAKRNKNLEDAKADYSNSDVSSYGRKKRKANRFIFTDDTSQSKDSISKKKTRKSTKDTRERDDDSINELNDIDFVEVDDNDPRIMNEDEAFFASLLPTVVKYTEDERLEFRIEVLGVIKKLKEKRKWLGGE